MGCSNSGIAPQHIYSKEYLNEKVILNSTPSYVNHKVENFEDNEKKWMNEILIEKIIFSFEKFSKNNCLGYRKIISQTEYANNYTFFNYEEVRNMSENFAYNSQKFNLTESRDYGFEGTFKMMGIYSKNCVEWLLSDISCQLNSITVIPLYDTLGLIAIEHIFNQTQLTTLCISSENIKKFIEIKKKFELPTLKNVIVFDLTMDLMASDFETLKQTNLKIYKFSDIIKEVSIEDKSLFKLNTPGPENILTICYTSGTTSLPKGAKISQRCIYSQMSASQDAGVNITPTDIHLSYLPLAHIMERVATSLMIVNGGSIGFISGEIRKSLPEDLKILHPTFFFAVPKVLSNFRDTIMNKISELTGCKRWMIEKAIRSKRENFNEDQDINSCFYDKLVFSKMIDQFGGKWRFIITGSAPLSIELGNDIKIIFGCPIIEGYGMTETGGAILCTNFVDHETGFVGGPLSSAKIRLEDCEELNYTSRTKKGEISTPCGEVCVKGSCCFSGYFNDKENTDKIFDNNGWLHTGDIGMLSTNQKKFKIIDRIKEIFKLNQGEYIAPGKLETAYSKCQYVSQICIYGQSLKTYIIAIITPKKPEIEKYLKEKEWYKGENIEHYYENEELFKEIKRSLDDIANQNKFNSLEKVHKIIISKEEFTIENELLTPTAKVVRRKIEIKFKEQIDKIYI